MTSELYTIPAEREVSVTEDPITFGISVSDRLADGVTVVSAVAILTDTHSGDAAPDGAIAGAVTVASPVANVTLNSSLLTVSSRYLLIVTYMGSDGNRQAVKTIIKATE